MAQKCVTSFKSSEIYSEAKKSELPRISSHEAMRRRAAGRPQHLIADSSISVADKSVGRFLPCPDCETLNYEEVSWCLECGCLLKGIKCNSLPKKTELVAVPSSQQSTFRSSMAECDFAFGKYSTSVHDLREKRVVDFSNKYPVNTTESVMEYTPNIVVDNIYATEHYSNSSLCHISQDATPPLDLDCSIDESKMDGGSIKSSNCCTQTECSHYEADMKKSTAVKSSQTQILLKHELCQTCEISATGVSGVSEMMSFNGTDAVSQQSNCSEAASTYSEIFQTTRSIESSGITEKDPVIHWSWLQDHDLPIELWLRICSYLSHKELLHLAHTNRHFYAVVMHHSNFRSIMDRRDEDLFDANVAIYASSRLKTIKWVECDGEGLTSRGIRNLLNQCNESLRSIHIERCRSGVFEYGWLYSQLSICLNLTSINLIGCKYLREADVVALAECCYKINDLSIDFAPELTTSSLKVMAQYHSESMVRLSLRNCFGMHEKFTSRMRKFVHLTEFRLEGMRQLDGVSLAKLLSFLTQLTHLELSNMGSSLKDKLMESIASRLPRLISLNLSNNSSLTDHMLSILLDHSHFIPQLKELILSGCSALSDASFVPLCRRISQLDLFDVSHSKFSHRSMQELFRPGILGRPLNMKLCGCPAVSAAVVALFVENFMSILHLEVNCSFTSDYDIRNLKNPRIHVTVG